MGGKTINDQKSWNAELSQEPVDRVNDPVDDRVKLSRSPRAMAYLLQTLGASYTARHNPNAVPAKRGAAAGRIPTGMQ